VIDFHVRCGGDCALLVADCLKEDLLELVDAAGIDFAGD
jgi:hypothetical protein